MLYNIHEIIEKLNKFYNNDDYYNSLEFKLKGNQIYRYSWVWVEYNKWNLMGSFYKEFEIITEKELLKEFEKINKIGCE